MSTHFHVSGTGITGPLARRASDNYKWWVLITAIFGAFVSILDATVVNTALPHIQLAFGTDLHTASYVVTGYLLAQGVVISASGFLATRFGIKRVYLLSLALFTFFSALCGLAWNIESLIFFRVLQGAGGAALFPLSFSLVFGAFPEEQRGLANGIFGIPVLVAPALGPVIWGYLLTVTGPSILALLLLAAFIPIELRTAQPLLDLRLFKRRTYLVGSLITWVAFACLFGSTFLLPQYLQVLRGLSSFQAGLLLAPQGLASMVGTIVVGLLYSRLGARPLVIMGAIAVALATYLMSQWLSLTSLFAELIPLLIVLGFGLPFLLQSTSTAALTGIEGTTLPGANPLLSVSRSAVSFLAVDGLVNLVQAQRLVHQAALAHHGPVSAAVAQQAQVLAYQDVYLLSALVTLPILVLAFFLRSPRRAQKPEPTTTFGVSAHTSEAAMETR